MLAFVTVGSTRFDELVQAALSSAVLSSLRRRGYTSLIVQRGNSVFPYEDDAGAETLRLEKNGVHIECWKFKPSLQTEYEKADIVISHAGSGTIVDVLRMNKPLIVVPNPTLLDNHQQELADALDEMEHLKATNIERLSQTILEFNPSVLVKFPPFEGNASAAAEYEDAHVHAIYEQIAPHFSSTRYKPWPVIAAFLETLPSGWIGVDSGTGNGKYLPLGPARSPNSVLTIGLDKSLNLLKIAQNAGGGVVRREVIRANVLDACWRQGIFDYSISIATVHHLATYERRKQAVQRLLQTVSPSHGRLLIYVWAVDQDEFSKREIPPDKHTGTAVTANRRQDGADVFVPWVFAPSALKTDKSTYQYNPQAETNENATNEHRVFNRYYHMFAKGELRRLVENAAEEMGLVISGTGPEKNTMAKVKRGQRGIEFVQDGWERSNYYVEVRRWTASELVETS